MLFRLLIGLSILFIATQQNAQVPELELVEDTSCDPFMPDKFYRTIISNNPLFILRQEKILPADFTGQFICFLQSDERILRHPLFAQFGKVEIYLIKGVFHYGIPVSFDNEKSLNSFINNIILPRSPSYQVFYLAMGKEEKPYRSFTNRNRPLRQGVF